MKLRVFVLCAVTVGLLFCFSIDGVAQNLSLSGTVRDTTGVVPGATVMLNSAGRETSTVMTDSSGNYRFDGLAPGNYELSFVMRGFETAVRNVTLGTESSSVDVVLALGRISTTMTVTAVAGKATATRLPIADDDVPAQVSSVPQELIRQQGLNSIADALRNASGVQAFRWYGVYEQFTIRGFNDPDRDDANVLLIDGMRMGGNRYATQTNNIQSVEVLKGPSSVLYGRGAAGGSINIVRKKPQADRAYDFSYRGGRFNTHQVAGGATGSIDSNSSWLYRLDSSYEQTDGWRHAGSDRFNISPSLTWIMADSTRLTVHETFNRDRFDGDGGVPINTTGLPNYRPDLRFSLPQDNVLVEDSQTHALFNADVFSSWEFRNAFLVQRTSDRYFVTEGLYGSPSENLVYREPLDFHHTRTPIQNQAEMVGRLEGFGRHTLLLGYEYQIDKYRTDVTAGDDSGGCTCGYWWETIAPMDITTLQETQTPLDITTIARRTWVRDRIHSFYWQDQIDVAPKVKINIAGRFDDFDRRVDRLFTSDNIRFLLRERDHTAYTYRGGIVYAPRPDQQIYFSTSSSFSPVIDVTNNVDLDPRTARNYEAGHRWQGWNGRIDTSLAFYYVIRNNLNFRQTAATFIQIGEQRARGMDLDVNTDLGAGMHLILNYGFTQAHFSDADDEGLTGRTPRYVPKHTANAWLRKDWESGFNAAIGARYIGAQFANNSNTTRLGGYTVFSGAVGYRAERWEWSLNAENLFDRERYFIPAHFSNQVFPGQPISVTSTIRLKFY
jgi:iron complex outermembrane receptor protein